MFNLEHKVVQIVLGIFFGSITLVFLVRVAIFLQPPQIKITKLSKKVTTPLSTFVLETKKSEQVYIFGKRIIESFDKKTPISLVLPYGSSDIVIDVYSKNAKKYRFLVPVVNLYVQDEKQEQTSTQVSLPEQLPLE